MKYLLLFFDIEKNNERSQIAALSGRYDFGCVRWYCKYGISYRELEEMLLERGFLVDHTTIYRWVPVLCAWVEEAHAVVLEAADRL